MWKIQAEMSLAIYGLEGFEVKSTHEKFYTKDQIKMALEKEKEKPKLKVL